VNGRLPLFSISFTLCFSNDLSETLVPLFNIHSNSGKNIKGDLQDAAAMIGKQGMIMIIAEKLETVDRTQPVGALGCIPSLAQVWVLV
jgi:hypothetical protein